MNECTGVSFPLKRYFKCDTQLSSYSGLACTQQQLLHSCDLFTDTSGSGGERV